MSGRSFVVAAGVSLLSLSGCTGSISGDAPGQGDADASPPGGGGAGTSSGGRSGAGGGSTAGGAGTSGAASGGAGAGGAVSAGGAGTSAGGEAPGSGGAVASGGAPGVAEIRVVGRTDGDPKTPRFEWSSVSVQARFKGTSVSVDLDGGNNNYFEVIVDGETKPRIATTSGRKTIPLAAGLPDTEHDLVLFRRTEALSYAPTTFYGLDFGGGVLLPIATPPHKLEIVGDSLTCGYGNEGAGPGCGFSYDTENAYQAYGAVAARALDADLYTECWSGKGMYRNNGGDMNETMPTLFDRTIPTEKTSAWDFSAFTPDAVVINLATNDFAKGDPGHAFVDAYVAFVAKLRTHYPDAYVFVIDGPAMSGSALDTARGYLDEVVSARKALGDQRIRQIPIEPQDQAANGIGCDYHPSVKTGQVMGQALAAAIKTTMGW